MSKSDFNPKFKTKNHEKIILIGLILVIIVALVLYFVIPKKEEAKKESQKISTQEDIIPIVTAEEIKAKLDNNARFIILDVRKEVEYIQGHITGATNFEMTDLEIKSKYLLKDIEIITMCDGSDCQRSTAAAKDLKEMGFGHVSNFKGGMKEWKQKAYPTTLGNVSEVKYLEIPKISAEELNSQIETGTGIQIIDIRMPQDFEKGHIPTAKNINFSDVEAEAKSNNINVEIPIVIYGKEKDLKSETAAKTLLAAGAKNIMILNKGFESWENSHPKIR